MMKSMRSVVQTQASRSVNVSRPVLSRYVRALMVSLSVGLLPLAVQAAEAGPAAVKADPQAGSKIAQGVCVACHGADGNSALPVNPNLAGQHPEYIVKQLMNFKSVDGAPALRQNAIMAGFVASLSEADMHNLGAWFRSQTLKPAVASNKELAELGQQIWRGGIVEKNVPSCAGCHGPSGLGNPAQYPALQGQHPEYTAAQLTAWRQGERGNSSQMSAIAARLSDLEIKALAEYAAGLR